jgi:hypothetical protein
VLFILCVPVYIMILPKVGVFLEKEQLFRRSIADALNKAIDLTQKKRQKVSTFVLAVFDMRTFM